MVTPPGWDASPSQVTPQHRPFQGYRRHIAGGGGGGGGVQNYWGERKFKKVGSMMLDNLRKINILQFKMNHKVKIPSWRCCRLNLKGSGLAEKREIVFLAFHTSASKFSRERWFGFTDKYMENKILICGLLRETSFFNLIGVILDNKLLYCSYIIIYP